MVNNPLPRKNPPSPWSALQQRVIRSDVYPLPTPDTLVVGADSQAVLRSLIDAVQHGPLRRFLCDVFGSAALRARLLVDRPGRISVVALLLQRAGQLVLRQGDLGMPARQALYCAVLVVHLQDILSVRAEFLGCPQQEWGRPPFRYEQHMAWAVQRLQERDTAAAWVMAQAIGQAPDDIVMAHKAARLLTLVHLVWARTLSSEGACGPPQSQTSRT